MSEGDTLDRWQRAEALFYRALDLPRDERDTQLREWCGDDPSLLAEVLSLLSASDQEQEAAGGAPPGPSVDVWIGRTAGPFRLERLLGRGGMGAVYFARRVEGGFEQQAAVKIISTRLTSQWLRQNFLSERQLLASLHHPHIARLLDGGVTAGDEPFLAMEYVDGERLDRYCEQQKAPLTTVIHLLLQLCDAVSYVHRSLIIHRDLKPGNVLVTADGRVKLLDFGTAKLIEPGLKSSGDATRLGLRAFTPEYASPEQIFGESVTTASDVYSLGVILYRLLTGRLPFDFSSLSSAAIMKTLYETEPTTPSQAVTRIVRDGDTISANARTPDQLQISGDLDAIVLKALRPAPKDRYASVDEFAADLRRYREHRPVQAREGSLAYRTRKFLRRHALGLTALGLILLALTGGLLATIHQARLAAAEERRALDGAREMRQLAHLLLFDFYDQVKQLPGSTDVQRKLVSQSLEYLDKMAQESQADKDLALDLLDGYTKMANVQGNPYEENLGDAKGAIATFEKAQALAGPLEREHGSDPRVLKALAFLFQSLGEVYFGSGETAKAVENTRRATGSYERMIADPAAPNEILQTAASAFDALGDQYGLRGAASTGDLDAARASYEKAIACQARVHARLPKQVRALRGLAIGHLKIGNLVRETDPDTAIADYRKAVETLKEIDAEGQKSGPVLRVASMANIKIGGLLAEAGRARESLPYLNDATAILRPLIQLDQVDTKYRYDLVTAEFYLGTACEELGLKQAAIQHYESMRSILSALLLAHPGNLVWQGHLAEATWRIGFLRRDLGQRAEGDRDVRRGLDLALQSAETLDSSANDLNRAAAHLLEVIPASWGDPAKALALARRAVEKSNSTNPEFLLVLARALKANNQPAEARAALLKARDRTPPLKRGAQPGRTTKSINEELASLH
ncbi:MAG: serine/threonine protein kinase [Bryobacterales bacterium]|nr:serine/threonine protein kinase [Bryobacterales bacterium]